MTVDPNFVHHTTISVNPVRNEAQKPCPAMPNCPHPSCLAVDDLMRECEIKRTRAGGPGGQHRNKVESAIVITHESGIIGQASERRSQHENRKLAVFRLRINLAINIRGFSQQKEASTLWNSRCRNKRIAISPSHDDFPCLLAEAMDAIFAEEFQLGSAAERLNCSTSQLIKLVKLEVSAFECVNQKRRKNGLSPLK